MSDEQNQTPEDEQLQMNRRAALATGGAAVLLGGLGVKKAQEDRQVISDFIGIVKDHAPLAHMLIGDTSDPGVIDGYLQGVQYGNHDGIPRWDHGAIIVPGHHIDLGFGSYGPVLEMTPEGGLPGYESTKGINHYYAKGLFADLRVTGNPLPLFKESWDLVGGTFPKLPYGTFTAVGFDQPETIEVGAHENGIDIRQERGETYSLKSMPVIFQQSPETPVRLHINAPKGKNYPRTICIAGKDITLDLRDVPVGSLCESDPGKPGSTASFIDGIRLGGNYVPGAYVVGDAITKAAIRYEFTAAQLKEMGRQNFTALMAEHLLHRSVRELSATEVDQENNAPHYDTTIAVSNLPPLKLSCREAVLTIKDNQPSQKIQDWLDATYEAIEKDAARENSNHARRALMDKLDPKPRGR